MKSFNSVSYYHYKRLTVVYRMMQKSTDVATERKSSSSVIYPKFSYECISVGRSP